MGLVGLFVLGPASLFAIDVFVYGDRCVDHGGVYRWGLGTCDGARDYVPPGRFHFRGRYLLATICGAGLAGLGWTVDRIQSSLR